MISSIVIFSACGELKQSSPETFFSETAPPEKQEFRWSNGKSPQSFDPAFAAAPPETDIVRAVYEGLTETDPKTLKAIPAIATSWKASDDFRVWNFVLRKDAKWSNGERVTAADFVRSWRRLATIGDKAPLHFLLHNIEGVHAERKKARETKPTPAESSLQLHSSAASKAKGAPKINSPATDGTENARKVTADEIKAFGVTAVDNFELQVVLTEPDEEFPMLVAHPIFCPVYGTGDYFAENPLGASIITNGAFRIASVGREGVTLDRDERYYGREKVNLQRVVFVPSKDADAALAAYRSGTVDAVTNTEFEPLALKILTPFIDFRRTTHSALNFYEFNQSSAPFNDRRVREALAISIDREKLSEGEMEGAVHPAFDFLPFDVGRETKFRPDIEKARGLLETAGYPAGRDFPVIRLVVNRNNTQEKIARSVAKMWKAVLNLETEVLIKDTAELEEVRKTGEYDLIRRGVVLPTADETANMLAIFSSEADPPASPAASATGGKTSRQIDSEEESHSPASGIISNSEELLIDRGIEQKKVMSEAEAIAAIPAIPLYFPTSYSLVKPYVKGFSMNTLDAPALKNVFIDNSWQPGAKRGKS